jgi:GDP-D-mannose 3',5'-epimerase
MSLPRARLDEFLLGDLTDVNNARAAVAGIDEVYQLAADMGGAGYIFTGEHDACVMHDSATINLNMLEEGRKAGVKKFFYSSSACIYPEYNQMDPDNPKCSEESAYPAAPDSEYGWEKLFSERLYFAYHRNFGVQVRVARFHNIFGVTGYVVRRQGEVARCAVPQDRRNGPRRRDRNLGRRQADALLSDMWTSVSRASDG